MDNKVVIRPNFLITTFLRPNMPIEVEIGRNFYRFTSKKSYYNGVCIVKYKEYVIRKQYKGSPRLSIYKILPFYFVVSVICTNFAKLIYNISGLTGFDSGMKWYVSMRSLDG